MIGINSIETGKEIWAIGKVNLDNTFSYFRKYLSRDSIIIFSKESKFTRVYDKKEAEKEANKFGLVSICLGIKAN
jgi:hypothetical protein